MAEEDPSTPPTNEATGKEEMFEDGSVALSLKCEDCGKLLRSEMEATVHASKTGHANFAESTEEIKQLTDEEKEEQRTKLRKKIEERRQQRLQNEKEEEKLRERNRRKTGQEISKAKDEHALQEMKKLAEERRREKIEEKRIKQQLREQIAQDRANFKAKQQGQKQAPVAASQPVPTQTTQAKKDYDICRIQIRLPNGSTCKENFKADDKLQTVFDYITREKGNIVSTSFTLQTSFPVKIYDSHEQKCSTLKELGLLPSVVLMLKNT